MKYCIDCKWLKEGRYTNEMCHSPKIDRDLVTGELVPRDAKLNRHLDTIGCGREAKWFEPKFELDDDEHIASVFCRGGA